MKTIDVDKLKTDESKSNPMVVAMRYPDCPINEICMYLAVGFGSPVKLCDYLVVAGDNASCKHE